ncbi:DNA polymerase II subunit B4-like [Malania oleifera]|uniref:DNA polymerase II subunit B4-like n=1 Tax=Malania oleifera TaxID=397392 RepID=UPI0025AE1D13|nr:DNA polymerase II subunit B4-like [Malania oleifera]
MGYDKGRSGWYLKAARTTHAPPASAIASASASTSASAPVSTVAQSSSTQDFGSSPKAPSWFLSFQHDFSSFSSKSGDDDDAASVENEGNSEDEGDEENTEEEGTQEEGGEEEEKGDGSQEEN